MAARLGFLTLILYVCSCAAHASPAKTLGAGREGGGQATILDLHEIISKRLGQHVWDPGAAAQEALRAVLDAASTPLTGDGHGASDIITALELQIVSHIKSLADAHTPSDAFIVLTELLALVAQLPRHQPVLVLRRAISAALILHMSMSPLAERAHLMALHLLRHLYLRHRITASSKLAVEFAHVSKSGGTTLCRLAQHNGSRTQGFALDTNCLITDFEDQPRYISGTRHAALKPANTTTKCDAPFKAMAPRSRPLTCEQRLSLLQARGYTMYANEYTSLGGEDSPEHAHACSSNDSMLTVLQLRHPVNRTLSHIKHVWHGYQVRCEEDRERVYFREGHNLEAWTALMPAPLNNYLIRSLLGEAVFNLPLGAITQEHLELAKVKLLQQYDVLLVLEDAELSTRAVPYGMGWHEYDLHANPENADAADGLPEQDELEALRELNTLDEQLYEYGVVLARLDGVMYDVAAAAGVDLRPSGWLGAVQELGDAYMPRVLDLGGRSPSGSAAHKHRSRSSYRSYKSSRSHARRALLHERLGTVGRAVARVLRSLAVGAAAGGYEGSHAAASRGVGAQCGFVSHGEKN